MWETPCSLARALRVQWTLLDRVRTHLPDAVARLVIGYMEFEETLGIADTLGIVQESHISQPDRCRLCKETTWTGIAHLSRAHDDHTTVYLCQAGHIVCRIDGELFEVSDAMRAEERREGKDVPRLARPCFGHRRTVQLSELQTARVARILYSYTLTEFSLP